MNGSWILSGILALPVIGALFILLLPGRQRVDQAKCALDCAFYDRSSRSR